MSENVVITNGQLFEFMTKMYSEMQEGFKQVNSKVDSIENEVKKTNTKIDHEVMPEIDDLFDGYIGLWDRNLVPILKVYNNNEGGFGDG
ncbi:hypothetical protein SAMN05660462_00666 [Proteiniborus ethanoligenes]|uniref:LXG domain of WXG superfamily protein n=1 Tax=Proteiniborus ethanoligenes TaxID=415015 RepID=A0A1H3M049_9FIRM|nr:hypothetical protein [Proteiniborus ethanoligenes]SDY69639.1 hypothetical protein SAMN05660462_00666 [Proteiniborus ethanoligenes]